LTESGACPALSFGKIEFCNFVEIFERSRFMAKVTEVTAALAAPIAAANGCSVWDVEYVREAGGWYLRVYIDKPGGISIEDCEAVSRPLSDALDQSDPIEGSYTLEVSSAGADRVLKKPEHFTAFLGNMIDVKLYRAQDGKKVFTGTLRAYDDDRTVTIEMPSGKQSFEKKEIAQVRLHVDF
jgi:ribosome maturation factor RimP